MLAVFCLRLATGLLAMLVGSGSEVGTAIVDNEAVAAMPFAGARAVGWGLRARAPSQEVSWFNSLSRPTRLSGMSISAAPARFSQRGLKTLSSASLLCPV